MHPPNSERMNQVGKEGVGLGKRTRNPNPSSQRDNGVPAPRTAAADVQGACFPAARVGPSIAQGARVPVARTGASPAQAGSDPGNYSPSTCASPVGGWWASPSEGVYPPGGFTNFLQPNGNNFPENFHFVGAPMRQPTVPPNYPCSKGTPSPVASKPVHDIDAQDNETIDIGDDDTIQELRTDKRLNWSRDEDIRLASAWLHNSKNSVDGNSKKADQYWADVTTTYNNTTESSRKRNRNQLKIRWERVKKPLSDFHGCWIKASRVWQSGLSDDQIKEKAKEMYAGQNNEKQFNLEHIWKVVRHDKKWSAYVNRLNKEKENNAKANPAQLVNLDETRPMGHKKAKKERNGKGKGTDALVDISEKLEKYIEVSNKAMAEREKMTEIQQSLAGKRIEAAKLNNEAAHEATKCKMLETYTQLTLAPTDQLTAEALAERNKALDSLRLALFPKTAS